MSGALLEQRSKRELLDYILASGARTREKLSEAERLLAAIRDRVESDSALKELLGGVVSSLRLPEPPLPSGVEEVGKRLEEYEKQLDGIIAQLRVTLESVDRLRELVPRAKELESRLSSWASIIRDANPPLYAEITRFAARLSRALRGLPGLELEKAYDTLRELVESGERLEARAKAEYNKTLRLLLGELEAVKELMQRALSVVMPHERLELEEGRKRLEQLFEELSEARVNPEPIDPSRVYSELSRLRGLASERLASALSQREARVLDAYSKLSASAETKLFALHELVELISRRAETSIPETLSLLYELSRKGLIRLFAKVA